MHLCLVTLFLAAPFAAALGSAQPSTSGIAVDKEKRTVTIDAKIAPRKLEHLSEVYPIEVIACWPHPKGKKAHETVVTIDAKPSDVAKALESLGLKPGKPVMGDGPDKADGPALNVYLDLPQPGGGTKRVPIERTLVDPKTNKPMPKVKYLFTGSVKSKPDPTRPDEVFGADLTGTLIAVFPVTNETVLQAPLTMKDSSFLKLETNKQLLPPVGTAVKLVLEVATP
jgi:hypothetical protein